jgi:hypothetical protein
VTGDWEQDFETCVAQERSLMVALVDAWRALSGGMAPAGVSAADAERLFAERYAEWRELVDAIDRLAREQIARA